MQKWTGYNEAQTLTDLVCHVPLDRFREQALRKVMDTDSNPKSTEIKPETSGAAEQNPKPEQIESSDAAKTEGAESKTFVGGYEVSQQVQLRHPLTNLLDTMSVTTLGSSRGLLTPISLVARAQPTHKHKHKTQRGRRRHQIDVRAVCAPDLPGQGRAVLQTAGAAVPHVAPPLVSQTGIRVLLLRARGGGCRPRGAGWTWSATTSCLCVKRILSFSPQLNSNFQRINGVIFVEDVPIARQYVTFNYGYQLEMHCVGSSSSAGAGADADKYAHLQLPAEAAAAEDAFVAPPPAEEEAEAKDSEAEEEDAMERQEREQRAQQDASECVARCKSGDYYRLVSVELGELRLLLCAEIDTLDAEGRALELKFGGNDAGVSVWSQCLPSGVDKVVQASRTFQTAYAVVTGLDAHNVKHYFGSSKHRNAQLMVFYNVLKDIKAKQNLYRSTGAPGSPGIRVRFSVQMHLYSLLTPPDSNHI